MADIAITAISVKPADANGTIILGTAGATLTAGQAVYFDPATSTYKPAQANALATQKVAGVALQNVASGQALQVFTSGNLTINAVGLAGKAAWLSIGAAGAITATDADVTAGNYGSCLGVFNSTTNLVVLINNSGVVR